MVALKSAIAFSVAILAVLIPLEYSPSMAALSPFAQSCRCAKLRADAPMLSYIRVVRAGVGVGLLWFSALAPSSSSWARRDAITLLGWFPPFSLALFTIVFIVSSLLMPRMWQLMRTNSTLSFDSRFLLLRAILT
jgi:hypothetical protein